MATVLLLQVCVVVSLLSAGVLSAPGVYHDQRQNGDFNLRTQLDNFIVVLIPTSSLLSSSWLNFAKRLSLQNHLKHVKEEKQRPQEEKIEAQVKEEAVPPMILDKSPYTVEVEIKPKTSPLSRLHPSPVLDISSDVMIALSPMVSLTRNATDSPVKTGDDHHSPPPPPEKAEDILDVASQPVPPAPEKAEDKPPKAPEVATEAALRPPEVRPLEEPARMVKKPKNILSTTLERVEKTQEKEERVKLLGSGLEICANNERRGEDGNCEPIKARRRSGEFFASSGHLSSLRFGLSPANEK